MIDLITSYGFDYQELRRNAYVNLLYTTIVEITVRLMYQSAEVACLVIFL